MRTTLESLRRDYENTAAMIVGKPPEYGRRICESRYFTDVLQRVVSGRHQNWQAAGVAALDLESREREPSARANRDLRPRL